MRRGQQQQVEIKHSLSTRHALSLFFSCLLTNRSHARTHSDARGQTVRPARPAGRAAGVAHAGAGHAHFRAGAAAAAAAWRAASSSAGSSARCHGRSRGGCLAGRGHCRGGRRDDAGLLLLQRRLEEGAAGLGGWCCRQEQEGSEDEKGEGGGTSHGTHALPQRGLCVCVWRAGAGERGVRRSKDV